MRTDLFDYDLPERFIAQEPVSPRDSSKLLVFDSSTDAVSHEKFRNICKYFKRGDVLVVNRSKVIPARIIFEHMGKEAEIFVLSSSNDGIVEAMVRPGKIFSPGAKFDLGSDVTCEVLDVNDEGT
ncbi:S-adenosylmethionine:tRNA ribosyltransferase-isomerase, partial [Candidatus Peregrinibacteria bacterium]|nr:S-adenosylmethionine:tRNA ribosyltransferase-isomerase [Candidatus Peregrinibacteria bacterium]